MSVIALGFTGWSVAVFQAIDLVKKHDADVSNMKERLNKHEALAGHARSLEMHSAEQRQVDDIQAQIDRRIQEINARMDRIQDELAAHERDDVVRFEPRRKQATR